VVIYKILRKTLLQISVHGFENKGTYLEFKCLVLSAVKSCVSVHIIERCYFLNGTQTYSAVH
jgi:hypothetical protein